MLRAICSPFSTSPGFYPKPRLMSRPKSGLPWPGTAPSLEAEPLLDRRIPLVQSTDQVHPVLLRDGLLSDLPENEEREVVPGLVAFAPGGEPVLDVPRDVHAQALGHRDVDEHGRPVLPDDIRGALELGSRPADGNHRLLDRYVEIPEAPLVGPAARSPGYAFALENDFVRVYGEDLGHVPRDRRLRRIPQPLELSGQDVEDEPARALRAHPEDLPGMPFPAAE